MSLLARPLTNLLAPSTRTLTNRRTYNTPSKQDPKTKAKPDEQEVPEIPSFSLKGLGVSPGVRAFLYVSFGVLATAETYTYGMWAWRWWKSRGKAGEEGD